MQADGACAEDLRGRQKVGDSVKACFLLVAGGCALAFAGLVQVDVRLLLLDFGAGGCTLASAGLRCITKDPSCTLWEVHPSAACFAP